MTATVPTTPPRQATLEDALAVQDRLLAVATTMSEVAADLGQVTAADGIGSIVDRIRSETFVITVLGDFKRGKSTLMNALLGSPVLPSYSWPCTAVVTEVRWGPQQTAVLFPRTEGGEVLEDGEAVPVDELETRIVIDRDDPKALSPYGRAVLEWPLPLLEHKVVLVDSPGLNEDPIRQEVTLGYLARTDAVVFVQDAQANMAEDEVKFLTAYLSDHEPFFVFNKINYIDEDERDAVRRSAMVRLEHARPEQHAADVRRVHWVNARAAVKARQAEDRASWVNSGVAAFQADLERFLATDRQRMKLQVPTRQLGAQRRELAGSLAEQRSMLDESLQELALRYDQAQEPLRRLREDGQRILAILHARAGALSDMVEARMTDQLRRLAGHAPGWAGEVVTDSKLSMRPTRTHEQAEKLGQEVAAGIASRVEQEFAEWVKSGLQPELDEKITEISAELDSQLGVFERDLEGVRVDLSGLAAESGAAAGHADESPLSRVLAGAGGFVLAGPAAGMAGLRLGPKEMLKALVPSLAITLAWAMTPLGAPILVVGLVVQGLIGTNLMLKGVEKKIRATVADEMEKAIRNRAAEDASAAARSFSAQLRDFETAVERGLQARLAGVREEVEAVLRTKQAGERSVKDRRRELDVLSSRLDEASHDLNDLVLELGTR